MPLNLEQAAKLAHLNIRKEGKGDEKHLMVDLKLEIQTEADILAEQVGEEVSIKLNPGPELELQQKPEAAPHTTARLGGEAQD